MKTQHLKTFINLLKIQKLHKLNFSYLQKHSFISLLNNKTFYVILKTNLNTTSRKSTI